jgi:serine/threonine protein kinase
MKHVTEPLRPPRELNPAIPEEMNALVVKLLAKDPAERYGSAGELLADLESQREDLPPVFGAATTHALGEGPQTAPRRGKEARRRRTSRTLAVAAVAMSVLLLGAVLPGLLERGAARELMPRTQEVAHGFIDPPAKATATAADSTPDAPPSTLSAASAPPAVPATPSPDYQTPAQSQYGGGDD